MIKVLKSQSHYIDRNCGWQLAAVGAESEAFSAELHAQLAPRRAECIAERGFDDDARRVLVLGVRNLQVKVAIPCIEPGKLQEGLAYMKEL